MLLLLIPQGLGSAGLDVSASVGDVLYRLGFQGPADIAQANAWVTAAELYQFADEAAKHLSYKAGVFVTYDASITVLAGTAAYTLPTTHVFTLAAWVGNQPLRMTTVRDLFALDARWGTTTGAPKRASLEAGSVGTITLYPKPTAGDTLGQVCQSHPAALVAGASAVELPSVCQDYFSYAMLAGSRGKESEAGMPEMAAHFRQRMDLYEAVIEHLWGPGQ